MREPRGWILGTIFWLFVLVCTVIWLYREAPTLTLVSAGLVVVYSIAFLTHRAREQLKYRRAPCQHGVSGGLNLGQCSECRVEREAQSRKLEESLRIAKEQEDLKKKELARLHRLQMGQLTYLKGLESYEFETAVANMYRQMGYRVLQTAAVNDGGKDIVLTSSDGNVECKKWGPRAVGRPELQKFFAAIHDEEAVSGFFVTTAVFSQGAREYAAKNRIALVDGEALVEMMRKAFPAGGSLESCVVMCRHCGEVLSVDLSTKWNVACHQGHSLEPDLPEALCNWRPSDEQQNCDRCGGPMRLVSGRYGSFWGCANYPHCKQRRKTTELWRREAWHR